MNIFDICIIVPVIIGFVVGLFKGLIKELISLAAIVLGILGARLFEPQVSKLLMSMFDMKASIAQPLSYLILFLAIVVVLLVVANLLDKLFSAIALGGLNKFLGGIFGALKYALIVSVLLNVVDAFDRKSSFIKKETKEESFFYEPLTNFAPVLWKEAKVLFDEDE
ncbi:CvpA family protein [Paludibacter sp. 221]|uniref:CvpA family protein n=1 Tax=Paludibacter sp. 221 TaxID=2302939 RepID=UPI0013D05F04|nr:CvpA family protein [Paludibacter sp. 221]NDV47689.1 CvpA family protein [Paludibacter sp. 221]